MVSSSEKNWILIRGLARGRGHWAYFPEYLKSAFPNDHFYFIDIPGNGELRHTTTPLSVSQFIPFFEEQLIQQNFDHERPTFGLSLSLGSMAMVEWAKQRPSLFQKIILMNTSAANFSSVFDRLSPTALILGFKLLWVTEPIQREILSLKATTSLTRKELINQHSHDLKKLANYSLAYGTQKLNIFRQLIAAALYQFPNSQPCNVILINGLKDKFVSPKCSQAIAKKWSLDLVEHTEAGHDIAIQYPDWIIDQMRKIVT